MEELTCQVNGKHLMFTNASARNKTLNIDVQLGGPFEAISRSLLRAAMAIVSGEEEEEEEEKEKEKPPDGCEEFMMPGVLAIDAAETPRPVGAVGGC